MLDRAGGENTGPLVGDVTEYGEGCIGQAVENGKGGGGLGADIFWYIQHTKWDERCCGISVKGYGTG